MSHAAALLVPLGVPHAPPRVPCLIGYRSSEKVEEEEAHDDAQEDSAWSDAGADAEPVWSRCWFHSSGAAAMDASITSGEVRVALGADDGSVVVLSRAVTRTEPRVGSEEASPRPPGPDESGISEGPASDSGRSGVMTRKHHRHNIRLLVASLAPGSDAGSTHSGRTTATASPPWSRPDPTIGTSRATASPTLREDAGHLAEDLLEAQYVATDAPTVIGHPQSVPHSPVPRTAPTHLAPPPHPIPSLTAHDTVAATEDAPVTEAPCLHESMPSAPWTLPSTSSWACERCLSSPDASAVVALTMTGTPSIGGVLLVQQASGRLTAWDPSTLTMLGTVLVRAGPTDKADLILEYEAATTDSPVYRSVARCVYHLGGDPDTLDVTPVRLAMGSEPAPPCMVVRRAGSAYALLLYVDAARAALLPAAVLQLPPEASAGLCVYELHPAGLALYTLDDASCCCSQYDIDGPWMSEARVPSDAALAMLQQQLCAPDEPHAPLVEVRIKQALAPASTMRLASVDTQVNYALLLDDVLVGTCAGDTPTLVCVRRSAAGRIVRLALPSMAEYLVPLGTRIGVVCASHTVTVHAALRGDAPHLSVIAESVCTYQQLAAPVPDLLVSVPRAAAQESTSQPLRWTAVLPLNLGRIVLGLRTGGLAVASLDDVLSDAPAAHTPAAHSHPSWTAPISSLQLVTNPRTGTRHLIGGTAQGDLGVWDLSTLRSEAAWSWFTLPLQALVPLTRVPPSSRLYGCVLCVSVDGTTALLALDDVRLVQLFPGCGAPLTTVAVREHQIWLVYGTLRARLWDLRTLEMVRSDTPPEASSVLHDAQPPWLVYTVPSSPRSAPPRSEAITGMLSPSGGAQNEAMGVLLADVRRAIEAGTQSLRAAFSVPSLVPLLETRTRHLLEPARAPEGPALAAENPGAAKLRSTLQPLLSLFWPTGLDAVFGRTPACPAWPGTARLLGYVSRACDAAPAERFCQSPDATAHQLLAGVSLALLWEAIDANAQPVLHSLLSPSFLAQLVGQAYAPPSLAVLAAHVLDENEVLRTAAKLVLARYMPEATERELSHLERTWRMHIPGSPTAPGTPLTPQAVLLLGLVMSERYAHFSPSLLKRVAAMVAAYLAAPPSDSLPTWVATELCCTGIHVWQHYIDTVALVRRLFCIATEPDDVAATQQRLAGLTLRGLARRATLELASKHSALFMSTLAMDILHAPSVEQSQVTLRLVAFLVRQKPLVLYPSLPRLVEAVVKSLNPALVTVRSSLTRSAAVMIKELVETYPSIAFHSSTQRLAVGTHDGPVVLYDLKSATRLYVLDGHSSPVTACSFSPDGRRFLSLCLDEGVVLLWRLSAGFLDMLRPHLHARGEASAYRSIPLHLGKAAQLPLADTLTGVSLQWRDAHGVHLRIGEAHVNLSVT
ncbi:hypothetical protein MNAN1_002696 [Malassezia nana]|uniref:WD repeat-containing protein 7 n=1 Tax=Malassezia nana TaxID=180528 RepID=A0AAF0EST6_9BASI|nr:hypothetical protein MNAN1_002696 [Malassezia nana]